MADRDTEKRSSERGMSGGRVDGVGGRQACRPARLEGGGYLDICTDPGFEFEASTQELRQMGLSEVWMEVVNLLGTRQFLELWRLLDREELIEHEGRLRMTMPRFCLYRRFQRNRYIESLAAAGCDKWEIQGRVSTDLGERLSERHIRRLMRGRK